MTVSVKMMKVMRWPLRSLIYKKFRVSLRVHHFEKFPVLDDSKFLVDVKWRGPKRSIGPRFRSVKRERSSEATITVDGFLEWEQDFECECTLTFAKESGFQPWDVSLVIHKVTQNGSKPKMSVLGTARVNLGDLAPSAGDARQLTKVPVLLDESETALSVTFNFVELRTVHEGVESNHRTMAPAIPCITGNILWDKDDAEESRVKAFKSIITGLSTNKPAGEDGRLSPISDESSQDSPDRFESDSVEYFEDSDVVDDAEISVRTSFRYGSIAGANMTIEKNRDNGSNAEDMIFFSGGDTVAVPKLTEETSSSDSDQTSSQLSMRRMLSWRKRKLSFRSPRARGEPLLNKAYGDNGGDEIDWDRRQSGFPEESVGNMLRLTDEKKPAIDGTWDFGETFRVGSWETKELTSRDGHMKLSASIFFASIDQRSESAAGESACTALVAVVADWLHRYSSFMPSRAEFDSLIRDGSAEWRRLCQEATYKDRFPDGHFDLETVLEAAIRPLSVVPEKSFIGFFQPEGLGDSTDFLEGAMSFDGIWDEVERCGSAVYIVSWNDHFFVLKVEEHSVYIIDTLGERLYEGCDQAYLLKFDEGTCLSYVPQKEEPQKEEQQNTEVETSKADSTEKSNDQVKEAVGEEELSIIQVPEQKVSFTGRNACREFVKGFFAAVPLRQLQSDIKKGLVGKDHLHKRLQIEFHFTRAEKARQAAV